MDSTESGHRAARGRSKWRVLYWLMWVLAFFAAPGPWVFDRFEGGPDRVVFLWLCIVMAATGIAGIRGRLPGVEPLPFIGRLTEDKPNPFYRRVSYTFAWSAIVNCTLLNLAGLMVASLTGTRAMKQIYDYAYFPLAASILALGAMGLLPRARASTRGEGVERRYFYGAFWAAGLAQPVLGILWAVLPRTRQTDALKLGIFIAVLVGAGLCARAGVLPRTRRVTGGTPTLKS